MSGRLIGVSCGTYYHIESLEGDRHGHFFDAVIAPEEIGTVAPEDTLLIACRSPAGRLIAQKDAIAAHLATGGTVIAGGESHSELWLPGVVFHGRPTNWWWWLEPGADLGVRLAAPHPLTAGMDHGHVTWHLHGHLIPPPAAEVLAVDEEGRAILYVDEASTPGRIVATTLDPMFHHGSWFMPATTRFLDQFLPNLRGWL